MITLTWDELEQHEDDLKEYLKERMDEDKLRQLAEDLCQLGYAVSTHGNCNNCKAKDCKYRPDWGDSVRWNCPLWRGEEHEDIPEGTL